MLVYHNDTFFSNFLDKKSNSIIALLFAVILLFFFSKFEILKEELEKHVNQRSVMIDKINSLNDEMNNSNIVTNVFNNDLEKQKINIIDHNTIKKEINHKENKIDLDKEVASIFGKK